MISTSSRWWIGDTIVKLHIRIDILDVPLETLAANILTQLHLLADVAKVAVVEVRGTVVEALVVLQPHVSQSVGVSTNLATTAGKLKNK
jgi:hypothetical protein